MWASTPTIRRTRVYDLRLTPRREATAQLRSLPDGCHPESRTLYPRLIRAVRLPLTPHGNEMLWNHNTFRMLWSCNKYLYLVTIQVPPLHEGGALPIELYRLIKCYKCATQTGFDPATATLTRWCLPIRPLSHDYCERLAGIGPALPPWQGDVMPLHYKRLGPLGRV